MKKEHADLTAAIITGVLTLVAAFMWFLVIKDIIKEYTGTENSLFVSVLCAVAVTTAAIYISILAHRKAHIVK